MVSKNKSLRKYDILYNPKIAYVVSSLLYLHVSLLAFFFLTGCFGDSLLSSGFSGEKNKDLKSVSTGFMKVNVRKSLLLYLLITL